MAPKSYIFVVVHKNAIVFCFVLRDLELRNVGLICFDQNDIQMQNGYHQHTNKSVFMHLNYNIIKLIILCNSRQLDYVIRNIRFQLGIRNYMYV